jgi:hypothetical protein
VGTTRLIDNLLLAPRESQEPVAMNFADPGSAKHSADLRPRNLKLEAQ